MAGVYIHIPFCHGKCAYCDFYSLARRGRTLPAELQLAYAEALAREFTARQSELGGHAVRTVYLGGGTPSVMNPEALAKAIAPIPMGAVEEFTIEVNPEDVTAELAQAWRELGINRVSMGVQSLVDSELKAVGRRHTAAEALAAVDALHDAGFTNISLDLIYGLPGQTADSFEQSLRRVIATGASHISAYLLSYEPGTALTKRLERGLIKEADDETVFNMYGRLCCISAEHGFEHYEISNFAKEGMRSRHNSSYWDLTPYLGIGPAAHSLDAYGLRRYHEPDFDAYMADPEDAIIETEDETDRLNDLLIISLRRREGLRIADLPEHRRPEFIDNLRKIENKLPISLDGEVLKLDEQLWLQTDTILRDLLFE